MMRLAATSLLLAIVLMSSAKLEASGGIEQAFDGAINAINFGGKADVALSPSSVKTLSRHWALVSEISVVRLS
jgi:hypothetical protein